MFWTNNEQARERLNESFLLFEGKPCFVNTCYNYNEVYHEERDAEKIDKKYVVDKGPLAQCRFGSGTDYVWISLGHPGWNDFRDLPELGWHNIKLKKNKFDCVFLARRSRNTRTHGLSAHNTTALSLSSLAGVPVPAVTPREDGRRRGTEVFGAPGRNISHAFFNPYYGKDKAPLQDILNVLKPGNGMAYSSKFCVFMCDNNFRWLYRNTDRIGFFSGMDTLSLSPSFGFYREEIMEDPNFTLNNIQEF